MANVWLDDERPAPKGWVSCRWPEEVIELISSGGVKTVSLDHDLGEDARCGYDVILWIEERVHTDTVFVPPKILVHSANTSAANKMRAGVASIERHLAGRKQMTKTATLVLKSCEKCPHCDVSRYYTSDSWEYVQAWNCTHPDLGGIKNSHRDVEEFHRPPGIGFEEDGDKPKNIPGFCPLLKE